MIVHAAFPMYKFSEKRYKQGEKPTPDITDSHFPLFKVRSKTKHTANILNKFSGKARL